jgi:serpin B
MKLFQAAAAGEEENPVISPLSVMLALGMVANGASGGTLDAFEDVLGNGDLNLDQINAAYKALTEQYTEPAGSTKFHIANAIWVRNGFQVEPKFLQDNADWYGAGVFLADFASSKTVDSINSWVFAQTEGLIDEMVTKLDPDSVMLLMNTIYMNNTWLRTFDAEDSREAPFSMADGSLVTVPYLNNGIRQEQFIAGTQETGVLLPYDDGKFGFLALLPEEGVSVRDYIASLDGQSIKSLLDSAQQTNLQLSLPKFEAEYAITLNEALKELGLDVAFDPNEAEFAEISKDQGLYIQEVFHRAVLKVNEKGTEAAAATGITMGVTSAPAEDFITLSFDRPFVYAIVALGTGLPIFLGALENPAK